MTTASLTRSFGEEDGQDLVVELRDNGTIAIREEPTTRRLQRGEKLPEVVIDVRQAWNDRDKGKPVVEAAEGLIDKLLRKLPIADFPERIGYQFKVWALNALKEEKNG